MRSKEHGIGGNTIVVFTSDNGGERFSMTWPLIGMKSELLEGGLRIPAIVRWPGRIAAGSVSGQAMITMDWMPTLLAAAGTRPDPAYPPDGEDISAALAGGAAPHPRKFYWRFKAGTNAPFAMATGNTCASPATSSCSMSCKTRASAPISRTDIAMCSIGSSRIGKRGTRPCWKSDRGRRLTAIQAASWPIITASSTRRSATERAARGTGP